MMARPRFTIDSRFLPFADAASADLPLHRLLRLSLFQVSVGMALALLNGTLNRVMIVELNVPVWLVSTMIALPLLFAPFRALMGYHSDQHRSVLGWRRVPYIWFGTLLQYGGLGIMPFALLVLSGEGRGPVIVGEIGAALAFLLLGAGLHSTQTAGLALATDIAPTETHCVWLAVERRIFAVTAHSNHPRCRSRDAGTECHRPVETGNTQHGAATGTPFEPAVLPRMA